MPFHQNPESASASAMRPISFTKKSFDGKYQFIRCHSVGGENLGLTPTYLLFQILLQPSQHEAKRESSNSALRHFSHQAKIFVILSYNSLIFRLARSLRVSFFLQYLHLIRPRHHPRQTCGKKLPTKIKTRRWQGNDNVRRSSVRLTVREDCQGSKCTIALDNIFNS